MRRWGGNLLRQISGCWWKNPVTSGNIARFRCALRAVTDSRGIRGTGTLENGHVSARTGDVRRTGASATHAGFSPIVAVTLAQLVAATPARGEEEVSGTREAVRVEARDSYVAAVLNALGASFDLRYRTSVDLTRPVTGSFAGALPQVVANLLKDYDYVAKRLDADRLELIVLRSKAQAPGKAAPTAAGGYPASLFRPGAEGQPAGPAAQDAALFAPRPPPGNDGASLPPALFQSRASAGPNPGSATPDAGLFAPRPAATSAR